MPRGQTLSTQQRAGKAQLGRHKSVKREQCPFEDCRQWFNAKGIQSHVRGCRLRRQRIEAHAASMEKRPADSPLHRTPKRAKHGQQSESEFESDSDPDVIPSAPLFAQGSSIEFQDVFGSGNQPLSEPLAPPLAPVDDAHFDNETSDGRTSHPDPGGPVTAGSSTQRLPQVDEIKVEYHRATGRDPETYAFEDFQRESSKANPPIAEPWAPFNSRLEFEFAELAHESHLSKKQVTRLLRIIKKAVAQEDRLGFDTSDDVDRAWEKAKLRYPSFSRTDFSVNYSANGQPREFTLHSRSLWDWILQQVKDPLLAKHFQWDAQRLSKFDGQTWVRFYDEPWTASKFAKVQTEISKKNLNAKPLAIIIWADTSKLSTFGTQKGHFIVARIGNLPGHIRNGAYLGGGRIIGFLPIVDEDPKERKKPRYVDFKNAVFHEAFRLFLEEVASLSEVGYEVACGDNITRILYPYIHILSADYEEQTSFVSNRGLHGLHPCPVCHIPKGKLSDITTLYQRRHSAEAMSIVNSEMTNQQKNEELKGLGLRNVKNAFWNIANTDVHDAMSFDRLHAYTIGLWQKHLFVELKNIIGGIGRAAEVQIEELVKAIPRWPKLAHFANGILTLDFADGKKWEDISKIIIHVAYQVITPAHCPRGFALLCLIRKWQELDMLLSFSVHTDKSLAAFEATLIQFHHTLEAYKAVSGDDDTAKDWDGIIKVHSHVHAARDIRMKGVVSNMDTKPNEKLNGAIRDAYHRQTNFKNVEPQLAELEDRSMASNTIRAYITACDDSEEAGSYPTESELKSDDDTTRSPMKFGPIYLGSRQRPISISTFVSHGHDDSAFINFIPKLQACVSDLLIREHLDACERDGTLVREMDPIPSVGASDLIHEFRYVEVSFEHKITWRLATDRLRCSPQVYGHPRYDSVVVNWTIGNQENHIVCKLIRVFVYETVNGQKLGLALVQPLNEQVRSRPGDARLGLCRVREKQRQASVVIPIRSVIRGTVIVEDVAHKDRNMEINI